MRPKTACLTSSMLSPFKYEYPTPMPTHQRPATSKRPLLDESKFSDRTETESSEEEEEELSCDFMSNAEYLESKRPAPFVREGNF